MSPHDERPDRRAFTAALAAAALAPLVATPEEAHAEEIDPVEALAEMARARFGKHLTDEQLREVKRTITRDQRAAEQLRRVKLQNGDEPCCVFRADVP